MKIIQTYICGENSRNGLDTFITYFKVHKCEIDNILKDVYIKESEKGYLTKISESQFLSYCNIVNK